jgi:hypothetical protein
VFLCNFLAFKGGEIRLFFDDVQNGRLYELIGVVEDPYANFNTHHVF